ncbi:thiol-disulfide isomerase/thioredoxin [Rhodovulum iodosum]|uniref:Thiol-disulfide isomerase/thioredoxin n=1 Tax=Rhodovulum iodosum TaxID=68291 RepID=A0ABV3XSV7_9RHOB|nr:TlpA disulfide reductase family protein [Rhodovulum robiginosum]RSK32733.1 TlpA family protein disulfide reductase [Rhodovulum robiginosum]
MRILRLIVLYTAIAAGANGALAADMASVEALREGSLKKLMFHDDPRAVPDIAVTARDGGEVRLSDYQGKWVVLNFWATWCAPCRVEMPALDRLQGEMGGPGFAVVTVATGRNSPRGIDKLFEETGVTRLPKLQDPSSALARNMGVMGLPVTVILNPEGQEIARMTGDAEWDSDSAKAIVAALMGGG